MSPSKVTLECLLSDLNRGLAKLLTHKLIRGKQTHRGSGCGYPRASRGYPDYWSTWPLGRPVVWHPDYFFEYKFSLRFRVQSKSSPKIDFLAEKCAKLVEMAEKWVQSGRRHDDDTTTTRRQDDNTTTRQHDDNTETPDPVQAQIPSHPGIKYLVRGTPSSVLIKGLTN